MFRNCIGETCDNRDIHEWIISDGRKDAIPSEAIITKYEQILQNGYQEKPSNIKELRYLLDDIFDQDNALYSSYEFSVMTISSHWMVTVIKENYYKLGLCSDEKLDSKNPSKEDFVARIRRNHAIVERISNLEQAERQSITNYYSKQDVSKEVPRLILSYYKTRDIELLRGK